MIIIGVLAAIAIPTFLAQRNRAARADIESNVRNASQAATSCQAANNGSYTNCATVASLQTQGFNPSAAINVVDGDITVPADGSTWTISGVDHDNLTGVTGGFFTTGANAGRVVITP